MSTDLLTIHTFMHPDEGQIEAVDGRELHKQLKMQKRYADWVKAQIESLDLVEGDDYRREVIEKTNHFSGTVVVERIDYWFRVDTAKHIALASRTPEGKAVRQFLIDRDKKLRQIERQGRAPELPDFTDPIIAARAWADQLEARRRAEAENEANKPKVQFYDNFVGSDGLYTLQNAGRLLRMGPNLFCRWLVVNKYLFRQGGVLVPYVEWSGRGMFITKPVMSEDGMRSFMQTFITPWGIAYFARELKVDIKAPELVRPAA